MARIDLVPTFTFDPDVITDLQDDKPCFDCLDENRKNILLLWFMYKLAEAKGIQVLDISEVGQAVSCYKCYPEPDLKSFELDIWRKAASAAGATVDGVDVGDLTVDELMALVKCWLCLKPSQVRAAYIFGLYNTLAQLVNPD